MKGIQQVQKIEQTPEIESLEPGCYVLKSRSTGSIVFAVEAASVAEAEYRARIAQDHISLFAHEHDLIASPAEGTPKDVAIFLEAYFQLLESPPMKRVVH